MGRCHDSGTVDSSKAAQRNGADEHIHTPIFDSLRREVPMKRPRRAGRLGDNSQVGAGGLCKHGAIGPAVSASANVLINGRGALRLADDGIHGGCCDVNSWQAASGAIAVLINNRQVHRAGDADQSCGGSGELVQGSANVLIGDNGTGNAPPDPPGYIFVEIGALPLRKGGGRRL